jgi:Tfp pilus assembly protein PilZ
MKKTIISLLFLLVTFFGYSQQQAVTLNYKVKYINPIATGDTVKGILFNPTDIQIIIGNSIINAVPIANDSSISVTTILTEQLPDGTGTNQQTRTLKFSSALLNILHLNTSTMKIEADPAALTQILTSFGLRLN